MNNSNKIFVAAITLLALLFTLFSFAAFSKFEISLSARSAALYEPSGGEFLYELNADKPLPMASTTKIMTALVALRECKDLNATTTIDSRAVGIEGSSAYLKCGESFTLFDLLHIMMLQSANDAAVQIAITVSGSVEDFARLMNETARDMGLVSTSFTNPSGLDHAEHYTTARELALITAEAMKYSTFRQIVSKKSYTATELVSDKKRTYINHNKLLSSYDGCIGVKTGYTKKSGRSLVSAAERDGVTLIAVTINAPDDWSDHKRILDYGFDKVEYLNFISSTLPITQIPVVNSPVTSISVRTKEDFGRVMHRNESYEIIYDLPNYLIAPIFKGQKIGTVSVVCRGITVGKIDVVADADAQKSKTFFKKFK